MTARAVIRTADLVRIAQAMEKAGVKKWSVAMRPDGTLCVFSWRVTEASEIDNPWDALEAADASS